MWCPNCHADVAAQVTGDNRRVLCANCGHEIDSSRRTAHTDRTQDARELLQRWAGGRASDPYGPFAAAATTASGPSAERRPANRTGNLAEGAAAVPPAESTPEASAGPDQTKAEQPARSFVRFDTPHDTRAADDGVETARPAATVADQSTLPIRRAHTSHDAVSGPHFDVQAAIEKGRRRKTNWLGGAGQLLAYVGVLGVTIGATMVVWGYFGGHPEFLPNGWFVTTAGQMLMFLGIVTLVSGGIERTGEDAGERFDDLARQLARIERRLDRGESPSAGPPTPPTDAPDSSTAAARRRVAELTAGVERHSA